MGIYMAKIDIDITAETLGLILKRKAEILKAVKETEPYMREDIQSEKYEQGELLEKIADALLA